MHRRRFLTTGLAATLLPAPAWAEARPSVLVGDMHFHLFFFGPRPASTRALAREMAAGRTTLAAWSLVGDVPWLTRGRRGFAQKGTPTPGAAVTWFQAELGRIKSYIAAQGLKIVATPADVDWRSRATRTSCCRWRVPPSSTATSPSSRPPTTPASGRSSWSITSATASAISRPSSPSTAA